MREQSFTGALGLKVTRDGIARTGQISHDVEGGQVDILRSAVVAFPDAGGGGGGPGPVVPMGR
jgi:hypothetical protein